MTRKLKAIALPIGLLPLCLGVSTLRAATPIATFSVTATVVTGCKVSGATLNGSYAAAQERATSSVAVSCTGNTQYSIAVIADPAVSSTLAIGKFSFPLQSLMNYALPSASAHNYGPRGMFSSGSANASGNNSPKPRVAFSDAQGTSAVALNTPPDTVFVAITY